MPRTKPSTLDPRTGRPLGDHGTALDAINFLLDHGQAPGEETTFLRAWNHGDLAEWPKYYVWLAARPTPAKPLIAVPLVPFALLLAWSHIPAGDVPEAVRGHPDYPANRDGRRGHLTQQLRPHLIAALAQVAMTMKAAGQ